MKTGGVGGGNTVTGLRFEKKVDLKTLLEKIDGYEVKKVEGMVGYVIYYKNQIVARSFKKYEFYDFLEEKLIGKQSYRKGYCQTMLCWL